MLERRPFELESDPRTTPAPGKAPTLWMSTDQGWYPRPPPMFRSYFMNTGATFSRKLW